MALLIINKSNQQKNALMYMIFLKSNSIFIFDLDKFGLVEFFGFVPFISVPNPGRIGLKMVRIEGNFG